MQPTPTTTDSTQGANGVGRGLAQVAGRDKQLREACCRFEAVFLNLMLQEMRRTVDSDGGIMPHSAGEKQVRQMFDERLTETMSRSSSSGLADTLYRGFVSHWTPSAARLDATA